MLATEIDSVLLRGRATLCALIDLETPLLYTVIISRSYEVNPCQ